MLLLTLLGVTGIYGARTIPLSTDSSSLREAILLLTGQETAAPTNSPVPELSPVPETDTPSPAATVKPVSTDLPDAAFTPDSVLTPEITASSPDVTPVPPLSEALSEYFSSVSPVP